MNPHHVGLSRFSKRDKYTDVSISQHRLARLLYCLGLRRDALSFVIDLPEGEIFLADWLVYYMQAGFFVKPISRPISKLVLLFVRSGFSTSANALDAHWDFMYFGDASG